jgi:hypothetical protein
MRDLFYSARLVWRLTMRRLHLARNSSSLAGRQGTDP